MTKKSAEYFIPLVAPGGSKPKNRQKFIREAREFLPELFGSRQGYDKSEYHLDVEFHYLYAHNKDLDNSLKALLDAMKWRVIPDDSCVTSLTAKIVHNSEKLGCAVRVTRIK